MSPVGFIVDSNNLDELGQPDEQNKGLSYGLLQPDWSTSFAPLSEHR